MDNSIGERVRIKRLEMNVSARGLDRLAGLKEGHTSLIESGERIPGSPTAAKLAIALGVSLDWLVMGRDEGPGASTDS